MELLQLRYFLEVARTQHVTQSARNLHVAQPAVTQAVRRLEKELGVPLLAPAGRNVALTEYGAYLRDRLAPLVEELDRLPEEMQTMASLENNTIHLNVLAASTLVTEAIIEYTRDNRAVDFKLLQNAQSELYDINVDTRPSGAGAAPGGMEYVCTESIYMAVPDSPRFRGRAGLRLAELKNDNFISLLGSRQIRWICDTFCRQAGFAPHILFESDSPAAVRNMIAANMGVGFWPQFTWGSVGSGHVLLLPVLAPLCRRDIVITRKENKQDNTQVVRFFEFLRDYFERCRGRCTGPRG